MRDTLGDRMKAYESVEAGTRFMPTLPILARVDGRNFKRFTSGMEKPYDVNFRTCMMNVAHKLVEETGALMAYTQSDEITLLFYSPSMESKVWFDGRKSKMTSLLASMTTLYFTKELEVFMPEYVDRMPMFDARVWQVPSQQEAVNNFIWREHDAVRNSVHMLARTYLSHRFLLGRNIDEVRDHLINHHGVNWNSYPFWFKRGMYIRRTKEVQKFEANELHDLPPKHKAHSNPDHEFERTVITRMQMPILTKVVNRVDVFFNGDEPIVEGKEPNEKTVEALEELEQGGGEVHDSLDSLIEDLTESD